MNALTRVRVVVADDDPIVRDVLGLTLAREPGVEVVGEAFNGLKAVEITKELRPDVLLLDLLMPGLHGLGVLREMGSANTVRIVVVCSAISRREILQALQLGARGILLKKSFDLLGSCLQGVLEDQYWIDGKQFKSTQEFLRMFAGPVAQGREHAYGLTQREVQIIELVTIGNSNREISEVLGISAETVKRHLANIYDKVGISNRLELAMFALEHGLISMPYLPHL